MIQSYKVMLLENVVDVSSYENNFLIFTDKVFFFSVFCLHFDDFGSVIVYSYSTRTFIGWNI